MDGGSSPAVAIAKGVYLVSCSAIYLLDKQQPFIFFLFWRSSLNRAVLIHTMGRQWLGSTPLPP